MTLRGTEDDLIPVWNIEGCNGPCQYYTRGGQTGRAFETYRRTPRSTGIENTTLSGLYGLWFILPDYFDDSSDVWHEFMIDPDDPYGAKDPNKQIVYVTKSKKTGKTIKTEYYSRNRLDVGSIMGTEKWIINADYQYVQVSDVASSRLLTYDPTKK